MFRTNSIRVKIADPEVVTLAIIGRHVVRFDTNDTGVIRFDMDYLYHLRRMTIELQDSILMIVMGLDIDSVETMRFRG